MDTNFEKTLTSLLEVIDTKSTADDFLQLFEQCLEIFLEMKASNEAERQQLRDFADTAVKTLQDTIAGKIDNSAQLLITRIDKKLAELKKTVIHGKDYILTNKDKTEIASKIEVPVIEQIIREQPIEIVKEVAVAEVAERIVAKINELSTDEDDFKIDASHIKNLPEVKKDTFGSQIGVHGPLWSLPDVDVTGITVGQSLKWDGQRWIPFTPIGGGNTSVYEETPTDSGNQIIFTVAHPPVAGTFRLYRGGTRQQVTADFTRSGVTITLLQALQVGETLVADYDW